MDGKTILDEGFRKFSMQSERSDWHSFIIHEIDAALAQARREGQEAMRERATQAIVSVRDEDLFEHSRGRVQDVLATIVSALPVVQDVLGRRLEGGR